MANKTVSVTLMHGNCLDKLKELDDNSVDSIVTDPPYGLAFMNKKWDYDVPSQNIWEECLRVLKPGGHLLAFSGSRTYHRMVVRIEDAGFEIRDQIMWLYGSGFPKSHNVGNAIDKLNGAGNRGHAISSGNRFHPTTGEPRPNGEKLAKYEARTEQGKGWEGWGTALKPAHEPIVMARKPFKGTVAQNVLEHGTGAINIDECRVGFKSDNDLNDLVKKLNSFENTAAGLRDNYVGGNVKKPIKAINSFNATGRWPANVILDEEAGKLLDEQSGITKSSKRGAHNNKKTEHTNTYTPPQTMYSDENTYGDEGGASRFYYCPKASKKDRNEGMEELQSKTIKGRDEGQDKMNKPHKARPSNRKNIHPTVKPTDLMAYLIRLVTPKNGVVLDPFMGSGSTGKAAVREGMSFIGIEMENEYIQIAEARIEHEQSKHQPHLLEQWTTDDTE